MILTDYKAFPKLVERVERRVDAAVLVVAFGIGLLVGVML